MRGKELVLFFLSMAAVVLFLGGFFVHPLLFFPCAPFWIASCLLEHRWKEEEFRRRYGSW